MLLTSEKGAKTSLDDKFLAINQRRTSGFWEDDKKNYYARFFEEFMKC